MHWIILLAGGSGTRFWPLSSPTHPKQLLPLAGPTSTAVAAVEAISPLVPRERILVVTGAQLADPLRAALGVPRENVLVEPAAMSTAPALVWATAEALRRDPEATLLSMHADWHLADPARFRDAAAGALAAAASTDRLVTVGVVPTRPDPGYGYVLAGPTDAHGVTPVSRFEEKPSAARAAALIAEGARWNSGLFAWRATTLLREVRAHTPEVARALPALEAGDVRRFFADVDAISIDVGVFERSGKVSTIPGEFPWDDVGTWEALARIRSADAAGNVVIGPVSAVGAAGCIAWSDGTPVVLGAVHNLIVVHANGRILVLPREEAPDLKRILDALPADVRGLP